MIYVQTRGRYSWMLDYHDQHCNGYDAKMNNTFDYLTSISSFSNVIPRLSKTWAFYMGILVQNKSTNDRSLLPG